MYAAAAGCAMAAASVGRRAILARALSERCAGSRRLDHVIAVANCSSPLSASLIRRRGELSAAALLRRRAQAEKAPRERRVSWWRRAPGQTAVDVEGSSLEAMTIINMTG